MKFPVLFKKHQLPLPTAVGWFCIIVCLILAIIIPVATIHPFLAITRTAKINTLIVEGWLPDYCLVKVYDLYRNENVKKIYVTGGPLEHGSYLQEYKTFAALGAATLRDLGVADSIIQEIPAPYVKKDRTLTSARTLHSWLNENTVPMTDATIVTLGIHSRRSLTLFKRVFRNQCQLGVLSIENRDYDPGRWFVSSEGLKMVITETISYCYTLLISE